MGLEGGPRPRMCDERPSGAADAAGSPSTARLAGRLGDPPPKHKAQLVSTFLVDSGNVSTALYESAAYNNSPRLKKPVISDSIVMGP